VFEGPRRPRVSSLFIAKTFEKGVKNGRTEVDEGGGDCSAISNFPQLFAAKQIVPYHTVLVLVPVTPLSGCATFDRGTRALAQQYLH